MSSDVAISVRGLSKSYTIRHNQARHTTLGEALVHKVKHPFERSEREEFWALDDLSFDVKQGEVLGVIGRNGAGKSTLLKLLSRITSPTVGEIHLYGRVGSLLEVGTGFHPELTGRENIFLNGSILGMRRREIDKRFDEIVDFAGIDKFLDTPVKRYSSGMYVRLAFAVAAHLDSEILLVDEVLAVGDQEFQARALGKVHELRRSSGRTVILVSHQLAVVESVCTRGLVLDGGAVYVVGAVHDALQAYARCRHGTGATGSFDLSQRADGRRPWVTSVAIHGVGGAVIRMGDSIEFRFRLHLTPEVSRPILGIRVRSATGVTAFGLNTQMSGVELRGAGRDCVVVLHLPAVNLVSGRYDVDIAVHDEAMSDLDRVEAAATFEIEPADVYGSGLIPTPEQSLLHLPHRWTIEDAATVGGQL
ncbi:MAG TPA: ABC transporter ATP-binding protein [Acidimicrobiales bacterium]|jgi:lipopolysaccharide transport system ATP-binding protein|nr:ABC transporter ATP-binding protein [Acidimicrobiales bacterium]